MTVQRYPLNFDELEKGTWLETEFLIRVLGCSPADGAKWNLQGLVALCGEIEREAGIVCRVDHNRIRLCDDAEACDYLTRRAEANMNGLGRSVARRALIDRERLTSEQRELAERRDRYLGQVWQAQNQEARKQRRLEGLIHRPQLESGLEESVAGES